MHIQEHVILSPFTTFHVGGPARYFISVSSIEELTDACAYAHQHNLPLFILGGGSNVLIADEGYPGLVIRVALEGVEFHERSKTDVEMVVGAGEQWDDVVALAVNRGLWGLENLSAIPGSTGGAPVNNIGAYGVELKDVLQWVEVYDTQTGMIRKLLARECRLGYRTSIFKGSAGRRYVITRVCMLVSTVGTPITHYKDVRMVVETYRHPPTLDEMRHIICSIRARKFPARGTYGTAGSFFTNPVISRWRFMLLKWRYPGMSGFSCGWNKVKVSAAWILDHVCGFKGLRRGAVGLYANQPLVLVADTRASAHDIRALAEYIQEHVYTQTGIRLVPEVTYLGFDDV